MTPVSHNYEYDIFISYRHNDNRSGGVSEFVDLLKAELAATLKEPVSIYFDKNAHDGLLENHNVDKTLEGKLKCLIFIPIISQTYCDPKSFAWQHEFVAFNKLAKDDALGRDIKLHNGNVASRILPIKIHDLDADDLSLIENELGSKLRGIEFIYRQPGVNRPLKVSDKKEDHQNHTDYSNQINKVANAIKEIVIAIKHQDHPKAAAAQANPISKPVKPVARKIGIAALIAVVLLVAGYIIYGQFSTDSGEDTKSIAVLPFENMSGTDDAYFTKGVTEDILTQISKLGDVRVLSRFTLKDYDAKGKSIQEIGKELGVDYLLTGSIRRSGDDLRIACQLVQVNPEKETWAENFDKHMDDVFAIQHDVATQVARYLKTKLSSEEEHNIARRPTENIVAYNYYLKGREEYNKYEPEAMRKAVGYFKEALTLDRNFALAWAGLADSYTQGVLFLPILPPSYLDSAVLAGKKGIDLDPNAPETWKALGLASAYTGKTDEAIRYYEKAIEINPSYEAAISNLGTLMARKGRSDEQIRLKKRAIKINPLASGSYTSLAITYAEVEMYKEAQLYCEKALEINSREVVAHALGVLISEINNQPEKARQHLRDLAAINPENASINEGVADVALNTDPLVAREYLAKAIRCKDYNNEINYNVPTGIGYLLWQEGEIDSAKKWLYPIRAYHLKQVNKDNPDPFQLLALANNYSASGETREALKWLRKLLDSGYIQRFNIMTDYRMASLRKEPEFIKMMEELGTELANRRLKISAMEANLSKE